VIICKNYHQPLSACLTELSDTTLHSTAIIVLLLYLTHVFITVSLCDVRLSHLNKDYLLTYLRQRVYQSVKLQIFNARSKTGRKPCVPPPLIAKVRVRLPVTIPPKILAAP